MKGTKTTGGGGHWTRREGRGGSWPTGQRTSPPIKSLQHVSPLQHLSTQGWRLAWLASQIVLLSLSFELILSVSIFGPMVRLTTRFCALFEDELLSLSKSSAHCCSTEPLLLPPLPLPPLSLPHHSPPPTPPPSAPPASPPPPRFPLPPG